MKLTQYIYRRKTMCLLLCCILTSLLLIVGCSNIKKKDHSQNTNTTLHKFISDFITQHPNLDKNDSLFYKAKKEFFKAFKTKLEEGILNELPFKFSFFTKSQDYASFKTTVCDKDSTFSLDIYLDLWIAPEVLQRFNAKEGNYYYIKGKFYRTPEERLDRYSDSVGEIAQGYYVKPKLFHARIHQLSVRIIDTLILANNPK